MNKLICAIIVSFNSPENLEVCINSALNQVNEIIVIDNSSDPDLKNYIKKSNYPEKVSFIFNESNKGLGCALNQGIRYSLNNNYAWTLLLDQDSVLSENMVYQMMRSYDNFDNKIKGQIASVVPVIFDVRFKRMLPSVVMTNLINKKIRNPEEDLFVHFHITSGSLIKNEIIKEIGLMNENFFIDFIDFDYCFRILNKNYKILLSKNALLYHSIGEYRYKLFFHFREHNPLRTYYQTRNRLFVLSKHGKKYKSFLYSESFRLISKFFKILVLESKKAEKIEMFFKGIIDFVKDYERLSADY